LSTLYFCGEFDDETTAVLSANLEKKMIGKKETISADFFSFKVISYNNE